MSSSNPRCSRRPGRCWRREIGTWEPSAGRGKKGRLALYSDGTFVDSEDKENPGSGFWAVRENLLVIEFSDQNNSEIMNQIELQLSPDGNTSMTVVSGRGGGQTWRRVTDEATAHTSPD